MCFFFLICVGHHFLTYLNRKASQKKAKVIQKNEATCFFKLFWSYSTACVPTPPPSLPVVYLYVGNLWACCLVPWENQCTNPRYGFVLLQTHHFGRERNWELQNAKSSTGDSRKFFRQQQSLGSTCTSARLSKRRGRSRWPNTQESQQGKQAQKWEEEAWSKEGEHFGPFGIFVCNKQRKNQSLVSVSLSHTEEHSQCCHGSNWLQVSSHSNKWRSKC